jgi:aerobic carbon-monoxide dehydrogenase large subunit
MLASEQLGIPIDRITVTWGDTDLIPEGGGIINPLVAEGQRHGGIAQGAAQAFLEEVGYDADGNPLTATLADYAFLSAAEVPSFELADMQTPTSYNPLGAKGIGEAGTIGSTTAVQNAIIDALAPHGIRHIDMPASPQRVWQALRAAAAEEGRLPEPASADLGCCNE